MKDQSGKLPVILDKVFLWMLLAFVPLVSLAFSPWQVDAVDLTKATILWVWVTVLLALWIAKTLLSDGPAIRRTPVDFVVLIFLGIILLATVFSIHVPTSLLGRYGRYEGLATYFGYALLFFFGSQAFFSYERVRLLVIFFVGSAAIASLYGLVQYAGSDPIAWAGGGFEAQRSFSTFGNPLALAGFLVTIAPIAASTALLFVEKKQKWAWLTVLLLIVTVLWLTFSRGAWLALVIGFLLLFLLLKNALGRPKWAAFLGVLLLASIVLVIALTAGSTSSTTSVAKRAISVLAPTEGSFASRLEIWKSTLAMIKDRPFLGAGPDTFVFRFFKYQTVEYVRLQNRLSVADNAHSYPLQLASTVGLPGAIVFLALFVSVSFTSFGRILRCKDAQLKILLSGLLAGAAAYLTHLLFALSVVGSTSILWMVAGALMSQEDSEAVRRKWKTNTAGLRVIVTTSVVALSLALLPVAVRPYLADFRFSKGKALTGVGDLWSATAELERATLLNPRNDRYKGELGLVFYQWGRSQNNDSAFLNKAVFYLNEAQKSSPLMVDNYYISAFIFREMGKEVNPRFYDRAIDELKKALVLEPNSPRGYSMLASVHLEQGRIEEAIAELKMAQDLKPNYPPVYMYFGAAYAKKGELEKARFAYEKALQIDPDYQEAREALDALLDKGERT
jgi:putative inorganic carbon (HCO3(-)) transporter